MVQQAPPGPPHGMAPPSPPRPPGDTPEPRSRGGATQLVTLIVAVIAIVGSVMTTIVSDVLSDNRRMAQERRGAYRQFEAAAMDFDRVAAENLLDRYRNTVQAIKSYQDSGRRDPPPDIESAVQAHRQEFETMRSRYLEVESALADVLLVGSAEVIRLAFDVWWALGKLYDYFVQIYNTLRGPQVHKIELTTELTDLMDAETWPKIPEREAFVGATRTYYDHVRAEVNPGTGPG